MNDFNERYFAGVRWPELALVVAVAVLGDLQIHVATGGKIDQGSILKACGAGLGAAVVYLRVPKEPGTAPELSGDADATGPKDDVDPSVVEQVVAAAMPPGVVAMAPELPRNIVKEVGRVLRRGIKL